MDKENRPKEIGVPKKKFHISVDLTILNLIL